MAVTRTSQQIGAANGGAITVTSITLNGGTALSNYLESTFAPTVTLVGGAGNTVPVYTTNTGRYTRIGNRVFVDIYLNGDGGAEGAGTGKINIALPIAAGASSPAEQFGSTGAAGNNATRYNIVGEIAAGGSVIMLSYWSAATTLADFTGVLQDNATRWIRLKFFYEV